MHNPSTPIFFLFENQRFRLETDLILTNKQDNQLKVTAMIWSVLSKRFCERYWCRERKKIKKGKNPYLSQVIQSLVIDTVFFKRDMALFNHLVHDTLVHGTLTLPVFSLHVMSRGKLTLWRSRKSRLTTSWFDIFAVRVTEQSAKQNSRSTMSGMIAISIPMCIGIWKMGAKLCWGWTGWKWKDCVRWQRTQSTRTLR